MTKRTIIIAANAAWNLANFRSGLIRAMLAEGYDVVSAAPSDPIAEQNLSSLGCRFAPVPIDSKGLSPLRDWLTFLTFRRLIRSERPFAFLGLTVKPNVYGSLAARLEGVPAINNISGLGTAFIRRSWLTGVVRRLYRLGLARSDTVFFQNKTDRDQFVSEKLVDPARTQLLPGSGIDLDRFRPAPPPRNQATFFLMVARMVRDKGVLEYLHAAEKLRAADPDLRFRIAGFLDVENRTAITRAELMHWVERGIVDYLGPSDDIRPLMAAADCVVLPSYREGTSRVLLEAAALARPIVTTDVPGCREVVDDGVNGFLCEARDADSLASAMRRFAGLSADARAAMGAAGRRKVERDFDEAIVIRAYLDRLAALA